MPILTTRRRGMRGYLPGSSPIPVYNFLTGGVLPSPAGCACKGKCAKCSGGTGRGWKRYNEIVTKRLGPGRYSILLKPGLSGLGQDDSGDALTSFGVPDVTAPNFGLPTLAPYPASPSSGLVYDTSEGTYPISGNPQPMSPTTQSYQVSDSGVMPVLNNPALSYLSSGAVVPTTASSAMSGSLLWWLLGGAALVGVVVLSGSGRRR